MNYIILVVFSSILLLSSCGSHGRNRVEAATKTVTEPTSVRVAVAESRELGHNVAVTGSLQPDETVSVSAEVAGRLAEVRYDFGQTVRKGDIIAELDKRELLIQQQRAKAALAQALARIGLDPKQEEVEPESTPGIRQAKAQMEDARFKYESAARLVKSGDISQERFIELEKTLHAREAALEAARDDLRTQLASIQALRADVHLAEKRMSDATVRAPFNGQIAARMVSPGQYMKENTPIVTLVKAYPLRLRVEIPENAAVAVRPGTTLTFITDAAPGTEFRARVTELNPTLDAHSRSLAAEARLAEGDPRLRPGMFVQVRLSLAGKTSVVVVPKEALYQIAGLTKIFTIRNGRAAENKIAPGQQLGDWVEVPSARIQPGDQVAVSKLAMLIDGSEVRVEDRR